MSRWTCLRIAAVLSLLVAFPLTSQAGWKPGAVAYANQHFGYFPGPSSLTPEQRGDIASIWGGGVREVRFGEDMQDDEQLVKLPGFFKKELKVFLRLQDHKAPLIVFIPGVFSNADDGIARAEMKWFSEMGYHVLTIPNCWSTDFAKALPVFKEEYPSGEANAVIGVTKWIIANQIDASLISSVQIMGESLGALTAAVVYSKDSRSTHPIFEAGATLTWPPIVLHAAMDKLDQMMTDTDSIYASKCHHLISQLGTKLRILTGKYLLTPTADEIACAPSIVAQFSFRKQLVKLAKVINGAEGLNKKVPDNLTFERFIKGYSPRYAAALSTSDQYGQIEYWLRQADPEAIKGVRILSSEDDFLNQTQSWDFPGFFAPVDAQLIVAHWGGHIGLTNTKAYEGLMHAQFDLQ